MTTTTLTDRDLFVVQAQSGWRIERPSGREIYLGLRSQADAHLLLVEAGYKYAGDKGGEWWTKR